MNEFDSPFNTLSYDEQVLSSKLGLTYDRDLRQIENNRHKNSRKREESFEDNIRKQMNAFQAADSDEESETDKLLKKMKKQGLLVTPNQGAMYPQPPMVQQPIYQQPPIYQPAVRETFVANRNPAGFCGACGGADGSDDISKTLNDNKFMIFLIIVVAVFCFLQYLNNQQMCQNMKEMMQLLHGTARGNVVMTPVPQPQVAV